MLNHNEYVAKIVEDSDFIHKAIPAVMEDSAYYRQLNKPVIDSLLLDSMETDARLTLSGPGSMAESDERPFHYKACIKVISQTTGEKRNEANRSYSYTGVVYDCGGIDMRKFNRISFWVYPDCTGFRNVWIGVTIKNDGEIKVPCGKYFENLHFINLINGQWNHVVWEIPYIHRDKVTEIRISHNNHGSLPDMSDTAVLYYSRLEVQAVDEDDCEGWDLGGRIAFCHSGYRPDDIKVALTGKTDTLEFMIKDTYTGEAVFKGSIKTAEFDIGTFGVMDFSRLIRQGQYYICAGDNETKPFFIDEHPFKAVMWKLINFFYLERCGMNNDAHIPCHLDCYCVHPLHPELKVPISGGWHDAGDLSQGRDRTADAVSAFLSMAENVRDTDKALYRRLLEEAKWGLDWLLKTRFGDGYHARWATIGIWTKNITGDSDDITWLANNTSFDNFCSAFTEAFAARVFKNSDAAYSEYLLKCAKEDFAFAIEAMPDFADVLLYGQGVCAAAELFKITRNKTYLDKGAEMAKAVISCQQVDEPEWEGLLPGMGLKGFFYTDMRRVQPLAFDHLSHEHTIILGLAELCGCAPDHVDYDKWYASVSLFGDYIKSTSKMIQPYGLLPSAIYMLADSAKDAEHIHWGAVRDGKLDPDYNAQVLNGIKLSNKYYLRRFPVAFLFRGFHGTLITKTKAVSVAAKLLHDKELAVIVQKQIEWVLGNNPFAQSTMYGEGYDFSPLFTEFSNDMTGAIPAGIQTFENNDAPYYPMMNCCTYKEVWVNPTSRLLWILSDLY